MIKNRLTSFDLIVAGVILFALLCVIIPSQALVQQTSQQDDRTVDHKWVSIAAGKSHSLAIKSNGTLWGWGGNGVGQLGDGTTEERHSPVQIGYINSFKNHP